MPGKRKKKKHKKPLETELYEPLKKHLEAQGYSVMSEVLGCDITATKGEDLIIVEMKRRFETKLLAQAAKRQRITDSVYVALPRPKGGLYTKRWRDIQHLLKRLEVGFIIVKKRGPDKVQVVFHPVPFTRRKTKAKRRAVITEINGRSGDFNVGGSVKSKLVTAYREKAIHIACALKKCGETTAVKLRAMGTPENTRQIMYHNHYGWFERIDKGLYRLSAKGVKALKDYPKLVKQYRKMLRKK